MDQDKIIRHGTIILVASVATGILNYAFQFLMIKMLTPVDYGILFSIFSVFYILTSPITTLQTGITKHISQFRGLGQTDHMKSMFYKSLAHITITGGCIAGLIILLSTPISNFLQIATPAPIMITGGLIFINFYVPIFFGTLSSLQSFSLLGSIQFLSAALKILCGITLVSLGLEVNGALWGVLIGFLCAGIVSFLFIRKHFGPFGHYSNVPLKDLYIYCIPVLIGLLSYQIIAWIDVTIVKHYFTPVEAGYYSSAALFGKAFLYIPFSMALVMFPKVAQQHAQNKNTLQLFLRILAIATLPLLAGILVLYFWTSPFFSFIAAKQDFSLVAQQHLHVLLQYMGIAMTPIALGFIAINYCFAIQDHRILCLLVPLAIVSLISYWLFHDTMLQVLTVLGISGLVLLMGTIMLISLPRTTLSSLETQEA